MSTSLTHNRLFFDERVRSLALDFRTDTSASGDTLDVIRLAQGVTKPPGPFELSNTGGQFQPVRFSIPDDLRAHSYLLRIEIADASGTGLSVDIGAVELSPGDARALSSQLLLIGALLVVAAKACRRA